jgi:hypothetical protein
MKPIVANHVLYQIRRHCALVMIKVLPAIIFSSLREEDWNANQTVINVSQFVKRESEFSVPSRPVRDRAHTRRHRKMPLTSTGIRWQHPTNDKSRHLADWWAARK